MSPSTAFSCSWHRRSSAPMSSTFWTIDSGGAGCRRNRRLRYRLVAAERAEFLAGHGRQSDGSGGLRRPASTRLLPMTMPLTVGPGSISIALTLGANPPPGFRSLLFTALAHAVEYFIIAVSIYICYRYADRILKKLWPHRDERRPSTVRLHPAVYRRSDHLERFWKSCCVPSSMARSMGGTPAKSAPPLRIIAVRAMLALARFRAVIYRDGQNLSHRRPRSAHQRGNTS